MNYGVLMMHSFINMINYTKLDFELITIKFKLTIRVDYHHTDDTLDSEERPTSFHSTLYIIQITSKRFET